MHDLHDLRVKSQVLRSFWLVQWSLKHNIQNNPVDTGQKLNVHKTFRWRPGRLLNILRTFSLHFVSTGKLIWRSELEDFNWNKVSTAINSFMAETVIIKKPAKTVVKIPEKYYEENHFSQLFFWKAPSGWFCKDLLHFLMRSAMKKFSYNSFLLEK